MCFHLLLAYFYASLTLCTCLAKHVTCSQVTRTHPLYTKVDLWPVLLSLLPLFLMVLVVAPHSLPHENPLHLLLVNVFIAFLLFRSRGFTSDYRRLSLGFKTDHSPFVLCWKKSRHSDTHISLIADYTFPVNKTGNKWSHMKAFHSS